MLASEIRYAVPHATFALEEVALGLYPTGNATVMLPRQIAWVHAQELLLTAHAIDAARAAEIGLVNRVVSGSELLPTALATASEIAGNAPLAVRETRRGVREILHLSLDDAWRRQEEIGRPLRAPKTRRRRRAPSSRSAGRCGRGADSELTFEQRRASARHADCPARRSQPGRASWRGTSSAAFR